MSETTAKTPYLGRYALVLVAGIVGMIVLNNVLIRFAGFTVPSGAASIVPPMIAALVVGQTWGRETGKLPENGTAWRFAVVAGLIFAACHILLTMLSLTSLQQGAGLDTGLYAILAGILLVTTLIVMGLNRLFVSIGAKGTANKT